MDKKTQAFNKFANCMSLWENMQKSGVDHIRSPCDPRKLYMKKLANEWEYLLEQYPDFIDIHLEKQYFESLFFRKQSG